MGFIKRMQQRYRDDLSLSSKLLISHMALILASSITIMGFFGTSVYNMLISATINSKQQTARTTATSVEMQIEKLITCVDAINAAFYRFYFHYYTIQPEQSEGYNADYMVRAIQSAEQTAPDVNYQFYLTQECKDILYIKALKSHIHPISSIYGTYWYGILSAAPEEQALFCPSLYLSPMETEQYGDLAYVRALPDPGGGEILGYLAVYISQESIIDALAQNLSVSGGASYIINSRDALVCDSDSELVGAYYINNDEIDRIVSNGGRAKYLGSEIIVSSYPVRKTDWKVVSVLPRSDALEDANNAVAQFLMIYGVVFVLSALLSIKLARSISGRIASVVHQMGLAKNTRPEKITSLPPARDEVGQLVNSYNGMVDALNELMDRETETAKVLRLSEFKALQAQINPHFLYNSLDMINWLARAGQFEQVSDAIQALGRFYKLTLSKKDTFGTVRKETEHAVLYVKLQNMRYENRIRFVVDIDENIQDCIMPKLVFQPLVENAILHGIMEREDKCGEVLLAGWRDGDDLVFLLHDNGVGMTAVQADRLLHPDPAQAACVSKTGSHIGAYNTHERLQLYYGANYGLQYHSTPGLGTEVEIRIPFNLESQS